MRLNQTAGTVETSGLTETTNFSIKVTGKAFKILLDGLYADKVAAVIRELSTNAYDAHLAIGQGDKPFDVHLPTIWDPTYRVRDYGVSMSHEQTMRLMSTIFDSTKDTSNTMVGAFGLGSKSPFSLVDTFSLSVIKDGEKRMYSAFFGSDGVPSIALLGTEATKEPQGVEFTMTIEQKDVRAFKERAYRILRWFPTHPNVYEGTTKVELPPTDAVVEGNGWMLLRANTAGTSSSSAYARQGCVMYPLNANAIPNLSDMHRALMQAPLVIDFPIGTLDVAASREALSYDAPTCANIAARMNLVSKEITELYGDAIKNAPTLWEAGKKRLGVLSGSGLPHSLVRIVSNTKWKDLVVPDEIRMPDLVKYLKDKHGITVTPSAWDRYSVVRSDVAVYFDYRSETAGNRWAWSIGDDALMIFFSVAGERPTYEGRRIREYIRQGYSNKVYSDKAAIFFLLAKEEDAKLVLEAMGSPTIEHKFTKDLPAPNIPKKTAPAPKRGTTKKEEVKARKVEFDTALGHMVMHDEAVVALDGDAYYAIVREGMVQALGPNRDTNTSIETFKGAFESASKCGYLPSEPVYLISTVYEKRLETFGKWHRIDDYVCAKAGIDYADKLFAEAEETNTVRHLYHCPWADLLRSDNRFVSLAQRIQVGPLYTLQKVITDYGISNTSATFAKRETHYAAGVWKLRTFGVDTETANTAATVKLAASPKLSLLTVASAACQTAYPLVSRKGYGVTDHEPDAVLDYIEALDLLRASKAAAASQQVA